MSEFTVEVCRPLPRAQWSVLGRCWTRWEAVDGKLPGLEMAVDGTWLPRTATARPFRLRSTAVALAEAYEDAGFRARIRCDEAPTL